MESTETPKKSKIALNPGTIKIGLLIFAVVMVIFSIGYWYISSKQIATDKAEIYAPLITLGPVQPGILEQLLVKEGDMVTSHQAVARLENNQFVRALTDGVIVSRNEQIGKYFAPGAAVATMIDPNDLRVIAHVAENKGLNTIRVGQKVTFTVDAFGSREFQGTVEEIAQSADQSSVVFSISDKRPQKDFSIKIKYKDYPELVNGMSAKVVIHK